MCLNTELTAECELNGFGSFIFLSWIVNCICPNATFRIFFQTHTWTHQNTKQKLVSINEVAIKIRWFRIRIVFVVSLFSFWEMVVNAPLKKPPDCMFGSFGILICGSFILQSSFTLLLFVIIINSELNFLQIGIILVSLIRLPILHGLGDIGPSKETQAKRKHYILRREKKSLVWTFFPLEKNSQSHHWIVFVGFCL